jgi:hypothetical protein
MSFKVGDIVVLDPPMKSRIRCPDDPGGPHTLSRQCHGYRRGAKAKVKAIKAGGIMIEVVFFPEEKLWKSIYGHIDSDPYTTGWNQFKLYIEPEPEPLSIYNEMEDLIF